MPFDFDAVTAPFRMQPGLRRLAPGTVQLTPAALGGRHFTEKLAALRQHPEHALLVSPGFDATPALHALAAEAGTRHPDCFQWHEVERRFDARALGWSVADGEVAGVGPAEVGDLLRSLASGWRLAALLSLSLVQDLAVIDGRTAGIPWLAVCLPSRWAPETKIGRHFAEVHAPVADNELLLRAGAQLAQLVTGTTRWERFVWSIVPDPALMQHPAHAARLPWPSEGELGASFRTEHQTFIPLPAHRQALFTIEVESRPLAQALDTPERARRLHAALASMSPAVLHYRGLSEVRTRLLEEIGTRAG